MYKIVFVAACINAGSFAGHKNWSPGTGGCPGMGLMISLLSLFPSHK